MQFSKEQKDPDHITVVTGDRNVKLAFVRDKDRIFLMSSGYEARWPSEILRSGNVSFYLGSEHGDGVASLVTDHDMIDEISSMFILKYGNEYYERYFSRKGRTISIEIGKHISGERDRNYYEWLNQEFDSVADEYDNHIFGNSINVILRDRSLKILKQYLKPGSHILDIGCGTGAETLELLKSGMHVTAVDISDKMLNNLREKARSLNLIENLVTYRGKASELQFLSEIYGNGYFQLAYSTYGALNCEPHIEKMGEQLSSLLQKQGIFIAGVYNKYCLSETLLNTVSLRFNRLSWRFRNPIAEGRSRFCIDVYSFSPKEFYSLFSDRFRLLRTIGIAILLPPSNYHRAMRMFNRKMDRISNMDRKLSEHWPFKYLGDHFIQVMEKIS